MGAALAVGYRWHLRRDRADATEVEIRFVPGAGRGWNHHSGWERLGGRSTWRDRNR